jgi:hypothetical protein
MKVTIEIDCTPIEARQFFGLPNVEPLQTAMMAKLEKRMLEVADQFSPEGLMNAWFASLPQSAEWAQKLFASMMGQNAQK